MNKCFVYCRVSGVGQISGDGYDRQLLACQKYAKANGFEIENVFFEAGVSGTKELDNRPALTELFAACQNSDVKTIIVERLDRLARDLMVSETIIGDMRKKGYTLISTTEPDLCSDDPSRKLVRQIFSCIAEFDKSMTVAKLRAARDRKRDRGERVEGRKPYGHTPEEALILDDMRSLREGGMLFHQITSTLNRNSIPARGGKPWKVGTVAKIVGRKASEKSSFQLVHQ